MRDRPFWKYDCLECQVETDIGLACALVQTDNIDDRLRNVDFGDII